MTPLATLQPSLLPADVRASLPTFLIIGAAKAGTTSLHSYLAEHPEICMSSNKEPMCFEPADWMERLGEYRELFEHPAAVRGEASIAYSAYPWAPEIPDRVRAVVPDARIVYLVRDPIQRMLSQYAQMQWNRHLWGAKRFPHRPFDELVEDLEAPMNTPVWCSRYATQIERWMERFGDDRVLVLDQRELLTQRRKTLWRVFEFLEVDPTFNSPSWDAEHNTATEHRLPTDLARRLGRPGRFARRVPGARRALTREIPRPRLTASQRERVVALLAPEADRLRAMTGLTLEHWTV
jgi:hypothetical protein